MRAAGSPADRFAEKTCPAPPSECLLWLGAVNNMGYGMILVGGRGGKLTLAHRLAWELSHGPVPQGALVLHKCDTPSCVNERHLFLGDQFANMADMVQKGRSKSARMTHCKHGHERTADSCYVYTSPKREIRCKACVADRAARYKASHPWAAKAAAKRQGDKRREMRHAAKAAAITTKGK